MSRRAVAIALVCASLAAACCWLWLDLMEQVWKPERRIHPESVNNPMLAATRLLERHGRKVRAHQQLGDVDLQAIPDGMLVLADNTGQMNDAQAAQLLAWVRRGNTLLAQPHWSGQPGVRGQPVPANEPPPRATGGRQPLRQLAEPDPIGAHLGVWLSYRSKLRAGCETDVASPLPDEEAHADEQAFQEDGPGAGPPDSHEPRQLTCVTLPRGRYPLTLETGGAVLTSGPGSPRPLWSDVDGMAVRVYAEGKGHVALLSDNYFNNYRLGRRDHAELLLGLAALSARTPQVLIVRDLSAVPWYAALWRAAHRFLGALAVLLLLLWWRAARRHGPVLPEPAGERRALLEHIEASGNWLWRAQGGREALLAAARQETLALLRRRAPELERLGDADKAVRLARLCGLEQAALRAALSGPAAPQPAAFTRQIQTLQHIRNHHERH